MQTVLVLEDDRSIMALIRVVIGAEGYNILEATSAAQAFEQFEANDGHLDLIIADVTLPISSGIQVALELRSMLPHLKIILTSGYPEDTWNDEEATELDELPSDSVITLQKPFVLATLLDTVHSLIGLPFTPAPSLMVEVAGP